METGNGRVGATKGRRDCPELWIQARVRRGTSKPMPRPKRGIIRTASVLLLPWGLGSHLGQAGRGEERLEGWLREEPGRPGREGIAL